MLESLITTTDCVASQRFGVNLQFRIDDMEAFVAGLPEWLAYRGPTPRPWGTRMSLWKTRAAFPSWRDVENS